MIRCFMSDNSMWTIEDNGQTIMCNRRPKSQNAIDLVQLMADYNAIPYNVENFSIAEYRVEDDYLKKVILTPDSARDFGLTCMHTNAKEVFP